MCKKLTKWIALCLTLCLAITALGVSAASLLSYDVNGDGKVSVWDLQAIFTSDDKDSYDDAVRAVLGNKGDELHKNDNGQWEIWSELGLRNMAKYAKSGDTFVLMQDIDMGGASWKPLEDFSGTLEGNRHTISNMKITKSVDGKMGFFGTIAEGGTVNWLNIDSINIIASEDADTIGMMAGECAGTIYASTVSGFVTDYRTKLPSDVLVGGMVGRLQKSGEIGVHVENLLPNYDDPTGIPNVSANLGMNFAQLEDNTYERIVALVGENNGIVDSVAVLQNATGKIPDPNAIAWVKNGDVTTYPHTLTEILSAINADGNSVVTLQADLSNNKVISVPYSSTWDLNGYTIRTNPNSGNCMEFAAAGTENKITTVKNGSIYHYQMGIRVQKGGVVVSNVKLYGKNAPCVGIYDTSVDYNEVNRIEDCELYNAKWGVFTYNEATSDFTDVNITITRSKLVSYNASAPSALFVVRSGSTGGTVTLGYDVNMYAYGDSISAGNAVGGIPPLRMDEPATVTIEGTEYSGLNYWTTDQSVIATESIAEITNGTEVTNVTNMTDLVKAVKADGNTKIKLLTDVTNTAQLVLPYSCSIDLNGYTLTNTSGDSLVLSAVGSQNTVTTVKNGTINHYGQAIRVQTGSVNVSNVKFYGSTGSPAIGFYDTNAAYRAGNKIDGCYIYSPNANSIKWDVAGANFSKTGVAISNTTIICPNSNVFGIAGKLNNVNPVSGVMELGEHVELYGKNKAIATDGFRYSGLMAGRTAGVTVAVEGKDKTHTLYNWSTDKQTKTTNVLLLGNSLSTAVPEELYNMAKADGMDILVGDLYHAGAEAWEYVKAINGDADYAQWYEFRVYNDMGNWTHGDIKDVPDAIDHMQWDHVSFQEWFVPEYTKTYEQAIAHHEADCNWVFNYLKTKITTPGTKFYCYQHWSRQVAAGGVTPDAATQAAQFAVIKQVTEYLSEKNDVILIPAGEAWQLARADSRIGDTMCLTDNLHDSGPGGGQYLNGCVFYEVMFGKSCIGNTWRGGNGPTEEKHVILQQHAHDAVAALYGADYAK